MGGRRDWRKEGRGKGRERGRGGDLLQGLRGGIDAPDLHHNQRCEPSTYICTSETIIGNDRIACRAGYDTIRDANLTCARKPT